MSDIDGTAEQSPTPKLPETAEELADGSVRYPLIYPVKYQVGERNEEIADVTMRRIKGKDQRAAGRSKNAIDAGFQMLARLSGVEEKLLEEFDVVDLEAMGDVVDFLSTRGPSTGSSSSAS